MVLSNSYNLTKKTFGILEIFFPLATIRSERLKKNKLWPANLRVPVYVITGTD